MSPPPDSPPSPLISDALRSPTGAPGSAQTASAKKPTGAELWNPSVKVRVIKEHDFRRYFHVEKGIGWLRVPEQSCSSVLVLPAWIYLLFLFIFGCCR